MSREKIVRIRRTDDVVVDFAEQIPTEIREAFVRKAILDAKNAFQNKMSMDELAYVLYRAYMTGLSVSQSEEFKKAMQDDVAL